MWCGDIIFYKEKGGLVVTAKKVLKSLGSALLYFGIYILWQLAVMIAAVIGMAFVEAFSFSMDFIASNPEAGGAELAAALEAATPELFESVALKAYEYSMHMTVIAGVLTILTYFIIFKVRKRKFTAEIGLSKMPLFNAGIMVLLGAALNPATILILSLIPFPERFTKRYEVESSVLTESSTLIMVITTVILAPILEEIVFRGLIHTRLKRCMPMLASMIISAWIFGMMHGAVIWVIYASVIGFILAWVYEKYNSLLASIALHFGFNLCSAVMGAFDEIPFFVYLASIPLSVGGIIFVQRTSERKIEFLMPKDEE